MTFQEEYGEISMAEIRRIYPKAFLFAFNGIICCHRLAFLQDLCTFVPVVF